MAVIEDIPGLTVKVIANGAPLDEYSDADADDHPKQATNYIEVHSEGTFEILIQFFEGFVATYGVRVEIRLDGIKVSSSLTRLSKLKEAGGHKTSGVRSKIGGRWHESNFVFSPFVLDQRNNRELDQVTADRLSKAGTITVLIHRIKNMRWPRARASKVEASDIAHGVAKFGVMPANKVNALGLTHHGDVGAPQQKRSRKSYHYDSVDGKEDGDAFAVFQFKYRSLGQSYPAKFVVHTDNYSPETLRTLGIVPAVFQPSPPATPTSSAHRTPLPQQQISAAPHVNNHDSLSCEELVAIVGSYRGHFRGLDGLNEKELLSLLQHHRNMDSMQGTKRKAYDDVEMGGAQKK
ncbi:hypothetical protein HBI70_068090 [Parastagonospora nodorum]|nr:hypothetical protein HBH51_241930 [Parastagonospora nodorum]KAH4917124.1 hypothetical protein HBI79_221790 [Parastagonospora nodorum]KAH5045747.1 hypothetical protein HBH96_244570 [Parastagonospora nodorum]KAH5237221.1 hypothetical protein HBI71_243470 [Parastagonospora nodorum]KAH5280947.1 hypothetical protein HBI70_068090 [Parastagonospora nodorum]